jgi:osmotically-inducible protein OsmY
MKEPKRKRKRSALAAGALGAAAAYFFDPQMGRSRRARTRDQLVAMFRRTGRRVGRKGRWLGGKAYGLRMKATHPVERAKELDDATLAHKVESEILRGSDKGRISVNAEAGIVVLRGEVDTAEQMNAIAESVMAVPGVTGVENLLHLPGEPARNKAPAREASARARKSARTGARRPAGTKPTAHP